ncbi:MAG: trigger factor [Bdellovibrionales bacterium]|nr:trigger factor [Bdellovibrionales bacterium]NQZ17945.1 trigger factor [Bdellovibrionales bacterium]
MKTNVESLSNLEKKLNVEIPVEEVNAEFLNAFKYLQKNVEIKGFRKGKTPIDKIRSIYTDKIKGDVAQNLVQGAYYKALKEHDLIPIGMPDIDFEKPEEDKVFSFTAKFEVQPEIEVKKTDGLSVEKEKLEIQDDQIQKTIDQILENQSKMEEVKLVRDLAKGDFAQIDFKGFMDGQPLENGEAQGHVLEIGSDSFIPGFEEALIGMKQEEKKTISLSFPEDYHVENLKGKPVQFEVTLHKINKKVTPELNDEFVKGLGEHNTVDEFKTQLRKDMEMNEEKRIEQDMKNRLFKSLVKENSFDVPEILVKEQREALVKDFQQRMQGQGFNDKDFAEYQEKWGNDFDETAEFMVRSALLIQKISKDNELNATSAELDAKLQEFADQTGLDLAKVKEFYAQGGQSANLEFQITEDKVFKFLLDKATVTEVDKEKLQDETN